MTIKKTQLLVQIVSILVDKWTILCDALFEECENEKASFLEPEKFVHLLYDNSTFRRSRFYFWAIACLNSFEQSISDALSGIHVHRTEFIHSNKETLLRRMGERYHTPKEAEQKLWVHSLEEYEESLLESFDECCNLETIRSQMQTKRNEITSLRDGVTTPLPSMK